MKNLKTSIILIGLISIVFTFNSCTEKKPVKSAKVSNDLTRLELKGNVKCMVEAWFNLNKEGTCDYMRDSTIDIYVDSTIFNESGNILEEITGIGDNTGKRKYTYDNKGVLVSEDGLDIGDVLTSKTTYTYKYDVAGNISEYDRVIKDTLGETSTSKHTFEYDEAGNISNIKYIIGTSLFSEEKFVYDEKGNLVEESNSSTPGKEVHKYNEKGVRTETAHFNGDGSEAGIEKYKYDDKGNLVESSLKLGGPSEYTETITYTYDANGNWLTKKEFIDGEYKRFYVHKIKYY